MADIKVSALPAATGLTADDLLMIVDDPAGTPVSQKLTAAQLLTYVEGAIAIPSAQVSGTANTIAAFDSAGLLDSLPDTTVTVDGVNIVKTFDPAAAGGTTSFSTLGNVEPDGTTPAENYVLSNLAVNIDSAASGNEWAGALAVATVSVLHNSSSIVNSVSGTNTVLTLGDSVAGETSAGVNGQSVAIYVNDGYTIGNNVIASALTTNMAAGSTADGIFGVKMEGTLNATCTLTGGYTGYSTTPQIDSDNVGDVTLYEANGAIDGDVGNFVGYACFPNINGAITGDFTGFNVQPGGTGSANSVRGLNVDLTNVDVTGVGNKKQGVNITDGTISQSYNYTVPSGAGNDVVDGYNFSLTVDTPTTGTELFIVSNNIPVTFSDTYAAGALGLGIVAQSYGMAASGAAGGDIDQMGACLAYLADAGSTAGTIQQFTAFRSIPPLDFASGLLTVNRYYCFGLDADSGMTLPSARWGFHIADTGADNWASKSIVVGATVDTPTNADCAIEISDKRALKFTPATTAEIAALTASEGMMAFDTTLGYAVVYDGAAWVPAGGVAGAGDLLAANNLSDLVSAVTALTNLGLTATAAELNQLDGVTLGTLATQSGTFSGTSSGTNTGDQTTVTGNAGTATALQTARNIGGVAFDGTANIVPATVTVADTADATCSVALFESATGDLAPKTDAGITYNATTGTLTATVFSGSFTGNVDTATALQTARNIGGVSFNGTADIVPTTIVAANEGTDATCFPSFFTSATGDVLPKTNAALTYNSATGALGSTSFVGALTGNVTGNVSGSSGSTTGNAATATALATPRSIGGVAFDGTADVVPTTIVAANEGTDASCFPAFFTAATGDLLPKTNAALTYNSNTGNLGSTTFTGALAGNSSTTTALANARTIGGVSFDGTANIVPQTIQSVDESADTTCFPLFITASGSQSLQPMNNTAFTFNSSTGALGATLLGGTLTTASQTNVTGVGTITTGVWNGTDIAIADGGTGASTAAAALDNLLAEPRNRALQTQTASYTLVLGDAIKYIVMNVGSANNLTVPANSTVAYPIGTVIPGIQKGAGQTTIVATGGVTINTPETLKLNKQWASFVLTKVGTDEWNLAGYLEAV